MFTTNKLDRTIQNSIENRTFQTTRIHLVMNLSTPQDMEFIQVKLLTADGKITGEPTYKEVEAGADKTQWTSVSATIKTPGDYRVEVYNSQGVEVGRTNFKIEAGAADEISMTEHSDFRTMASGTLDAPGKMKTTFQTGQKLYYWVRINSPKSENIYIQMVDAKGKEVWKNQHATAVNTEKGARVISWKGAGTAGKYYIKLLNSKGIELAGHEIIIQN